MGWNLRLRCFRHRGLFICSVKQLPFPAKWRVNCEVDSPPFVAQQLSFCAYRATGYSERIRKRFPIQNSILCCHLLTVVGRNIRQMPDKVRRRIFEEEFYEFVEMVVCIVNSFPHNGLQQKRPAERCLTTSGASPDQPTRPPNFHSSRAFLFSRRRCAVRDCSSRCVTSAL